MEWGPASVMGAACCSVVLSRAAGSFAFSRTIRWVRPMVVSGLLLSTSAWAKHWHEEEGHWDKHVKHHDNRDERDFDHHADGCHFQPRDVRVIGEYYAPRYRRLPPGLEKKYYGTGRLQQG